jgi:hypothetical protein
VSTSTITLEVDPASAAAFATASADERRRIELLLKLRLREITAQPARPLGAIMDEIGDHAAAQGMTPEKLDELLRDQ